VSHEVAAGLLGLQSEPVVDLVTGASQFWSLGSGLTLPLFNAGRIQANIQVQNARQQQGLARDQQAVLTSLEEVESAPVAYTRERERRHLLAEAVEANLRALELANQLYSRGLADLLNVLESQRSLYNSQDQLVQSDRTVLANLIAL
jgi:multidrug efflux system outer membrane protein